MEKEEVFSKGKFILIEGLNGSGKTTQAQKLAERLNSSGIKTLFNHEPTNGDFGKIIRQVIEKKMVDRDLLKRVLRAVNEYLGDKEAISTRQFNGQLSAILQTLKRHSRLSEKEKQVLFIADRLDDILNIILPNLKIGTWMVQDRYDLSCYFHGMSNGVKFEKLKELHREGLNDCYLAPDILFYYWVPVEVGLKRLLASAKIIDFYENEENLKRIELAAKKILGFETNNPSPHHPLISEISLYGQSRKVFLINAEPTIEEVADETWQYVREAFNL